MSAFDGVFGNLGGHISSLFANTNVEPAPPSKKSEKAKHTAAATAAAQTTTGRQSRNAVNAADHAKPKNHKRQESDAAESVTASHQKKRKAASQQLAAAADKVVPSTTLRGQAAPQTSAGAAAGGGGRTGAAGGVSAASRAAQAAATKLLRRAGEDAEEFEPPPLHETLQALSQQQRKKSKKQKHQPPAVKAPVEREAAVAAEQPASVPATVVAKAQDHAIHERLDRTVFVGNLKATTKPKALKQLFSRYGQVESVRLRSVPLKLDAAMPRRAAVLLGKVDADRASAHAYVVFATPEEAKAALAHNMQVVDDLHMRVDMATGTSGTAEARSYSRGRSIFVGNLHFGAQDEDLVRFFSDGSLDPELDAAVSAVRVVRDSKTNIGRGIAFVEFKTKAAAAAAMRLTEPKLNGRPLRISFLKQPKAGAAAAAIAAAGQKPGRKLGSRIAQERIQKRHAAAGGGKTAAKEWMGVRTKGVMKSSAKPKGASVAVRKVKGPSGAKKPGHPGKPKRAKASAAKKPRLKPKK